jgi:dipeptidyl aminopeptidase/acylaminoacyl peptidase
MVNFEYGLPLLMVCFESLADPESITMYSLSFKKLLLTVFLITAIVAAPALCNDDTDPNEPILIKTWLSAGPVTEPMPVFNDIKNLSGKKFELKNLLEFEQTDISKWRPAEDRIIKYSLPTELIWHEAVTDSNDFVTFDSPQCADPQIAYLATYIQTPRWLKTKLTLKSNHLLKVYLHGASIADKTGSDKEKEKPGETSKDLELETGKHLLIVKSLRDPNNTCDWKVSASFKMDDDFSKDEIKTAVSPRANLSLTELMDVTKISSVSVSPDGSLVAIGLWRYINEGKSRESWLQLCRTSDNSLLHTYRGGMKISRVNWAPETKRFSYTSTNDDKTTLWIVDVQKGTANPVLEDIKDLTGHWWSPQEQFIIYSISEKPEDDKTGVKLLKGMEDRQSGYRKRNFLYLVDLSSGARRRLTAGKLTTSLHDISPDGTKILFTHTEPDYTKRPYSKTVFLTLDLATMQTETLWKSNGRGSASFSPDGTKLLVTGGPNLFGEIGHNVPEGMIPNDYDTQAYIYDIQTGDVDPITKEFNPEVDQCIWSRTEDCIYFKATDRTYGRLYRYDLNSKEYKIIDAPVEVMGRLSIARNAPVAAYTGSSVTTPNKAYILNLQSGQSRLFLDPAKEDFDDVVFGQVSRWTFVNTHSTEIEGRVYYPPNFDPEKKYPCIVYYYGGTSPTTRYFGGSHYANLCAANGYIVYILQPSGATGFGQAFSALHVNDWGIIVADEIIDGVKKFLDAHPFVDPEKVGCTGASYGGFMTMLLQTRTDIFAAAISHAGISSISSYWGEGYWGYLYSAVSAADSFPWSRKDIFIEQSPLFHADKINTPLLLLHGSSDTNVPPGESIQLYTALKLLGKETELIEFKGENHGIADYKKRIRWAKSKMAWFDRFLKDQPQWWDNLYEEK